MTTAPVEEEYPQLRSAIQTYIAKGNEDLLVVEYQQRGEDDLEFSGLSDELQRAAKNPASAAAMFRETLGFEGDPSEIRTACIQLYNRLKGVGVYDATKQEKVEGQELFNRTAGQPLRLNGQEVRVAGRTVSLGAAWLAFFLIGLLGYALNRWVPWPSWLSWFPSLFTGIAFLGLLFTSAALVLMRSETRDPARAARREKAIQDAKQRREARKGSQENWFRRNMTF